MKLLKKSFRIFLQTLLGILIFVLLYVLVVFVISQITVNSKDADPKKEVSIFLCTNGVHTDIVVPLKNTYKNWNSEINPVNTVSKDTMVRYAGFGWGDKEFYLHTPTWSDLKLSTACKAAFYMGNSALHVTFFKVLHENAQCIKIDISGQEYKKLVVYIENSLQHDNSASPIMIPEAHYGNHDSFYEARGKYSLFYTCNTWTNNALKACGQKAALWALTDSGIFCHYR